MTEFGVFYQVYKNHKAVRFVLENFRKQFPDNPVVLISDGGDDFTSMADAVSYTHLTLTTNREV